MSIGSGYSEIYDINIFNADGWKISSGFVTKEYVDDNFANLFSSNLFRGFNYFQNGISFTNGNIGDGTITLYDLSNNSVIINKAKFDSIDASINFLNLNTPRRSEVTAEINNMKNSILNGAGPAYDTLLEIQNQLIEDDTISAQIINSLATKAPIDNPTFTGNVSGITKSMVGLSNVDNTSDLLKPISTSTQTALDLKANDNAVVKLTGNQTIANDKTFTGNFKMSGSTCDIRPTGQFYIGGTSNTFFPQAITNPPVVNGISSGVGAGASFNAFNLSINSWIGTGFVCSSNQSCNLVIDHRNGNLSSRGAISAATLDLSSNLTTSGDVFCRNLNASAQLNLTGNLNMNNSDLYVRGINSSGGITITNGDLNARNVVATGGTINGGLTITNGITAPSSDLNIRNINAKDFTATGGIINGPLSVSGGITAPSSDLDIRNITAKDFTATGGIINGGLTITGGITAPTSDFNVRDINARNFVATGGTINGGLTITNGITAPSSDLNIRNINANAISTTGALTSTNLLLQGDNTNGYIKTTNANSTLYIGANNENIISVSKDNTTIDSNVTINGNITSNGIITCSNFNSYSSNNNNITNVSFPSGFGNSNVPCFSCSVPTNSQMIVQVSCPVSHIRNLRQTIGGGTLDGSTISTITENRTSMVATIFKNGSVWRTNVAVNSSTSMPFSQTITFNNNSTNLLLLTGSYEVFIGGQSLSFTPDYEQSQATYDIYLSYSGTANVSGGNLSLVSSGIVTNTTISTSLVTNLQVSNINAILTGYATNSYSVSYPSLNIESIDTGIITSFPNQVLANKMSVNSFECVGRNFKAFNGIAGYFVNGSVAMELHHIFCSLLEIKPNDFDTYVIVFAGYKVVTYQNRAYTGTQRTFDNTNGTSPQIFVSNNTATSLKVYYMGDEITFPFISYQ